MGNQLKVSKKIQATILYADLTGINELSEKIEVGQVSHILNQCLGLISQVVDLFGGSINKMLGNIVVASFGINGAIENTPKKTVIAALEIQSRISEFNEDNELPHPVGIKIGIKTGTVIAGEIKTKGQVQQTVMGEAINLASRVCDIADPGQVITDIETFEKTKDSFNYYKLEPVPIKSLKQALAIFEVKGRKLIATDRDMKSKRMISSAMVGRDKELRVFEKQFMQLINGRGSVVGIVGKAGIGKSRLLTEIRQNDMLERVAVFEGRALSNGQNLSFHPIIQIIKSWAGIKEEDSPDVETVKIQRGIRRVNPEAYDEIFPFIATMMGYRLEGKPKERIEGIEGEALENLIMKNLRDLLSRAASVRPVVIVIEDAHWCDISSIIFLESLFKLTQKHRILFVNVFRPGYKDTGERIQKFLNENLKDHHQEINIEPLTKEQSDELIDNLLQKVELPDEINKLIIDRASGNPFFIEEVIRSFIDEGLIEIKENSFLLTENIRYANIPETIDNVILSRIDRLDGKTKELLKTASVIGRNFYFKVLEEAAQTIEEVDSKLEYLKDIQLINERKHKDEVEFLFKHALAQQATYDSIIEKSRKDLHLKIAKSIEKVFAGRIHEFYGTLAHHYSKAGQQDKTEEYLIKAGEESMKSGASSEAVNFFNQALQLLYNNNIYNKQKIIDLEEKMVLALGATGQYIETVKYCERLFAHYDKPFPQSDLHRLSAHIINIIRIYWIIYFVKYNPSARSDDITRKLIKIGRIKAQALTFVDPKKMFFEGVYIVRFLKRKHFGNYEAMALLMGSALFFYTGIHFSLGKSLINWGKNIKDEKFVQGWLFWKFCVQMYDYYVGKKPDTTDEEKVIKYSIQIGEYYSPTTYYFFACLNLVERGEEKQALHLLNRIFQISEAFDSNACLAQYHRVNIAFNLKFRKLDEVLLITDNMLSFLRRNNLNYVLIALYSFRSLAFTLRSEFSEARTNLIEAEKYAKSMRMLASMVNLYIAKTWFEIEEYKQKGKNKKDARQILKTSWKLINLAQKAKKNLTEAYRLRASIFWMINKPNKTLRNFRRSIESGLGYDCKLELSRTYFEAGKFLRDPKNRKERIIGMNGTECLLKAKSMFEEMNLEWDLGEYEKYMEEGMI